MINIPVCPCPSFSEVKVSSNRGMPSQVHDLSAPVLDSVSSSATPLAPRLVCRPERTSPVNWSRRRAAYVLKAVGLSRRVWNSSLWCRGERRWRVQDVFRMWWGICGIVCDRLGLIEY